METPQVIPENLQQLSLADLYDLLAEETVKFNKLLLQKTSKEHLSGLKTSIKELQQEIQHRKEQVTS